MGVNEGDGMGRAFVSLRTSDMIRVEVGELEKAAVAVFWHAREKAPGAVLTDEFQALRIEQGHGGGGGLATTLLQYLDDILRWSGVGVQAATNETRKEEGSGEGSGHSTPPTLPGWSTRPSPVPVGLINCSGRPEWPQSAREWRAGLGGSAAVIWWLSAVRRRCREQSKETVAKVEKETGKRRHMV